MQKDFSERASVSPATQKISCLLRSPKYQYRACGGLPLVRILSQINPFHVLSPYFCDTHSNVIFPTTSPTRIKQILLLKIREFTCIFRSINFKMGSTELPVLRPLILLPASCATQFIFLGITDFYFNNINNYTLSRLKRGQGEYWPVLSPTGISDSIPGQSAVFFYK